MSNEILREWINIASGQLNEEQPSAKFSKGDTVVIGNHTDASGKSGVVTGIGRADGLVSDHYATVKLDSGEHISVEVDSLMSAEDYEKVPSNKGLGSYQVSMIFQKSGEVDKPVTIFVDIAHEWETLYRQAVAKMARDSQEYKDLIADGWTLKQASAKKILKK